jgi:hypothetical protein
MRLCLDQIHTLLIERTHVLHTASLFYEIATYLDWHGIYVQERLHGRTIEEYDRLFTIRVHVDI